jgi:hypothetical protein
MDGEHLMKSEGTGLIPCEDSVPRQAALIADRSVANAVCMLIEIVGNHKVNSAVPVTFLKLVEEGRKITAQNVVRVNNLKILTAGPVKALINTLAVAAVLLMNDTDDVGILLCVIISDLTGTILGAVIDDNDLHTVSAGQKALYTFFHVLCRIVAGHGYG